MYPRKPTGPKGDQGDPGVQGIPGPTGPSGTFTQSKKLTTDAAGAVTWTFDTPFAAAPDVTGVAQSTVGSTDVINVQLDGVPTTTQAKLKVTRTQQSVVALLGLTILSIPASVGATVVHGFAKPAG